MKNKFLFTSSFFFLIIFHLSGQISPGQKDSLRTILPKTTGVQKMHLLNNLVDYYQRNNTDSTVYFNDILLQMAQKSNNRKYIAAYYTNLAVYNSYQAKYYEAIDQIKKAISIQKQEKLTNDLADAYKALAGFYYYTENYNQAVEVTYKALKIYESLHNYLGVTVSFNNIGLLNEEMHFYNKAVASYKKGISLIDKYHLSKNKAKFYANLGVVYKNTKRYDSALYYYQKSVPLDLKQNSKRGLAHTYYDIANLYAFYLKNKDSAQAYYHKSLSLSKAFDKGLLPSIYSAQAKMYLTQKQTKKGIPLMEKALQMAQKNGSLHIQELAHYKLYEAYKQQNKLQLADQHLNEFVDIRDSINSRNSSVALANIQAKYENEKKMARIKELELKKETDKKIKHFLMGGLVLLLISLLLIVRNFFIKRKKDKIEKELMAVAQTKLNQDLRFKNKELTGQALMMMQKNKLLGDILNNISDIKPQSPELIKLKRKLKKSMHSEDDWALFKHYFEEVNKDFFTKLKQINDKITPAELKLSALIKLRFNIKESAALLNISPDSVKTARYVLRKKLDLKTGDNIYDFLNNLGI